MKSNNKYLVLYLWQLCWLAIVTTASAFLYVELLDLALLLPQGMSDALKQKAQTNVGISIQVLGGILFWWRLTKVLVLHGSPFTFGLKFLYGRPNTGLGGRGAMLTYIGATNLEGRTKNPRIYLGAVFRPHQSSDKLIRTRLEFLICDLLLGVCLEIKESRIRLCRRNLKEQAERFTVYVENFRHGE